MIYFCLFGKFKFAKPVKFMICVSALSLQLFLQKSFRKFWQGPIWYKRSYKADYAPSNFLKAVFHKCYLVHSWILWHICTFLFLLDIQVCSNSVAYFFVEFSSELTNYITNCDALRDLVSFVHFKKGEKHPCRSVTFSKVTG